MHSIKTVLLGAACLATCMDGASAWLPQAPGTHDLDPHAPPRPSG